MGEINPPLEPLESRSKRHKFESLSVDGEQNA